jgi:hypothetical protein
VDPVIARREAVERIENVVLHPETLTGIREDGVKHLDPRA